MEVELAPVAYEDKSVLANLLELYNHDMSEFYSELKIDGHGLFGYRHLDHYWTEEGRFPYFIRVDGDLAGFVLVRTELDVFQIAEFFVLHGLRRRGVGATAARIAFRNHPGRWEVWHATANRPAAVLWRSAVPATAERGESDSETVYRFEVT